MSLFWHRWILVITLVFLFGVLWLLITNYRAGKSDVDHHRRDTTHDGISESYLPIPAWWAAAMLATIVFAFVYLALYPGLGNYKGLLGWTPQAALQEQAAAALNPKVKAYLEVPAGELLNDADAMHLARRIFRNNCSSCHGFNAQGSPGFPDLSDNDWLYGNTPEAIKASITSGRTGMMPPMAAAIGGDEGTREVTEYILSLTGNSDQEEMVEAGKSRFAICIGCHGIDGTGNPAMGAPNLADNVWLFGGSREKIHESITLGRSGVMPAHAELLSPEKIHLLTAYVMSLPTDQ